jgi:hypothetical protein
MLTTFQRHRSEFEKEAELAHRQHTMRASRPLIDSAPALPSTSKIISQHIVSLRRNSTFSGRDSLLEQLKNYLSAPKCSQGAEPVSCLLHGMGGIGKTQTALEYTYRYQEIYNHIFWLPAETTSELVQAYSLISVMVIALGLTSSSSTLDAIQTARTWLETTGMGTLYVNNQRNKLKKPSI